MDRGVRIPVKVVRPGRDQAVLGKPALGDATHDDHPSTEDTRPDHRAWKQQEVDTAADRAYDSRAQDSEAEEWRNRALRLQADMENYRRRQQRLAQDRITGERDRLLNSFLHVVDDLERALSAPTGSAEDLRQGLQLTHRSAVNMLAREGVQSITAVGQPFDPNWHDAVATVGRNGTNVAADTVVRVVEPGYRHGDRLLRPAKVVVAI